MAKKTIFKLKNTVIALTLLVFSLCALLISVEIYYKQRIFPNTYIAGIYVGNMTPDQAKLAIEEKLKDNNRDIEFLLDNKTYKINKEDIGFEVNADKSISRVINYYQAVGLNNLINKLRAIARPNNFGLFIKVNENKVTESLNIFAQNNKIDPVYPSARIVGKDLQVISGKNGKTVNTKQMKDQILIALAYNKNSPISFKSEVIDVQVSHEQIETFRDQALPLISKSIILEIEDSQFVLNDQKIINTIDIKNLTIDDKKLTNEVKLISSKINRPPQDSVFVINGGKVSEFKPSRNGLVVKELDLKSKLVDAINQLATIKDTTIVLQIPTVVTEPKIKNEDVNNLGISTLLGRGVSYFKGSIPNRVHNIELAQSKFTGILIRPDETLSFNSILGDVSSLTGYKSAYVIQDGKTVLGDGGGVCQVSTTLFRAALNAGLQIAERRAHSYRVGYYEQQSQPGFDATIYYPTTDFKFKNNTGKHILIQPILNKSNSSLTFEIYGTDDGRRVEISKAVVSNVVNPEEDLYIDDATLNPGEIKQVEYRANGARVSFTYKVTRNGEVLSDNKFISVYKPWRAVFLRGI